MTKQTTKAFDTARTGTPETWSDGPTVDRDGNYTNRAGYNLDSSVQMDAPAGKIVFTNGSWVLDLTK